MDSSEPPPVGEDGTGARLLRAMSFEEIVQESTTEMGHSVLALRKAVYLEELSKSSRDLLATDDRQTEEDSTEDLPDTTEDLQELAGTVLTQEPGKTHVSLRESGKIPWYPVGILQAFRCVCTSTSKRDVSWQFLRK